MTLDQCTIAPAATFDSLVREHKNRIYTYICRLTNDCPDAEDLTQEVFVRAYQSFAAFRREAAIDTWLYRIATNLVIDRARRLRRAPQWVTVPEDAEEDPLAEIPATSREADPAFTAQLGELRERVRRAIATLPPKLRAAVVLHDMEGVPYSCSRDHSRQTAGPVSSSLSCPRRPQTFTARYA